MILGCCILICKSLSSIDIYVASLEAFASALYSTCEEDKAIVVCFLDDQHMGILTILNTKLVQEHAYFLPSWNLLI